MYICMYVYKGCGSSCFDVCMHVIIYYYIHMHARTHARTHTHARLTCVFLVQGVTGSISMRTPSFAALASSTLKTPPTLVAAAKPSTTQPSSLAKWPATSCRSSLEVFWLGNSKHLLF